MPEQKSVLSWNLTDSCTVENIKGRESQPLHTTDSQSPPSAKPRGDHCQQCDEVF